MLRRKSRTQMHRHCRRPDWRNSFFNIIRDPAHRPIRQRHALGRHQTRPTQGHQQRQTRMITHRGQATRDLRRKFDVARLQQRERLRDGRGQSEAAHAQSRLIFNLHLPYFLHATHT